MHNRLSIPYILTIFAIVLLLSSVVTANDWEYWARAGAQTAVLTPKTVRLDAGFRFRDDFSDYYYQHTDIGLKSRGPGPAGLWTFLRLGRIQTNADWKYEIRPYIYTMPQIRLLNLTVSNRFRLEYLYLQDADNKFRYRNLTSVRLPTGQILLFRRTSIYYEWYWNLRKGNIDQQRMALIVNGELFDWIGIEVFFLHKWSKKASDWTDTNIIGTTLRVAL